MKTFEYKMPAQLAEQILKGHKKGKVDVQKILCDYVNT